MKRQPALCLTTLLVSTLIASGCGTDAPPVATLEIDPASGTVAPGGTLQLTATAKDAAGNDLTVSISWSSSDNLAATVTDAGLVTGVANGSAMITATADGESGTVTITVQLVATVNVTPANTLLHVGASTQLVATPLDGSGNVLTGLTVNWTSDNDDAATVDVNGVVDALAFGTALITAEIDGTTGVGSVRVQEPVTGSWTGGFDAFGGSCGLTLSLTEAPTGVFTGTGTLTGPSCNTFAITFNGANSGHVVTATLSADGPADVPFNGNFDGKSTITGAFSGPIVSTNWEITRTSLTPTPPSGPAREGSGAAYGTYAAPRR